MHHVPRPTASAPSTPRRSRTQAPANPASLAAGIANINLGAANRTPEPKKYYIVTKGRKPGIYSTWAKCQEQIDRFSGNAFESARTLNEAIDYWKKNMGLLARVPAVDDDRLSSLPSGATNDDLSETVFGDPPVYTEYQSVQALPATTVSLEEENDTRSADRQGSAHDIQASMPVLPRAAGGSVERTPASMPESVGGRQSQEDNNRWWTVFQGEKQGVYPTREGALEAIGDQGGSFYAYLTHDEAKDAFIDYIMHGRIARSRN